MPLPSGNTIYWIPPQDNPNEGREKINHNFSILATGTVTGFSASLYTNTSATTIAVGGIPAGTTFPGQNTLQQMLDSLLYPYQAPTFSSFSISGQSTTVEVGTTISGTKTFLWGTTTSSNVSGSSITIRDTTNATNLATGLVNDGSQSLALGASVQKVAPASHVWTISAANTQEAAFSKTFTVAWRWRCYFGTSTNTALTEAQIEALAHSELSSNGLGTFAFAAGGYKYFSLPATIVSFVSITDTLTGFNVPLADSEDGYTLSSGGFNYKQLTVTNTFGVPTTYRVYRTKNILNSSITIKIA